MSGCADCFLPASKCRPKRASTQNRERERKREGGKRDETRVTFFFPFFIVVYVKMLVTALRVCVWVFGSRNTAKDKNIPPVGASRHLFSTGRCLFLLRRRYCTTTCCHFPFCRTPHFSEREMVQRGWNSSNRREKRHTKDVQSHALPSSPTPLEIRQVALVLVSTSVVLVISSI